MLRNILIVDDNAINRKILRNILKNDYEITEAENGKVALEIMLSSPEKISALLLDIVMPVMNGYDVLKKMSETPELSQIPVIATTSDIETESEVKALTLGANDFIIKPYNPEIIKRRIANTIKLRENAAVINAIKIDALTGLYTRSAFFEKCAEKLAQHDAGYYVMACFDIDGFKIINDQYGNKKGDDVLKQIADIFQNNFDTDNSVCSRITADNFAAMYPLDYMESGEVLDIQHKFSVLDGSILPISFSIGRYIINDLSLSVSSMYDRAVIAKMSIKRRYDKHIAIYEESMRDRILEEQEIISEMNSALASRQFEIWLQAQYNHVNGKLVGAEALVRWRHPQKGLVSPGKFIPIFEKNGFIYELDKFVWEEVCSVLRRWLDEGRSPLPVSVNISRYDVFRDDFVDVITGLVGKYDIPVDLLRLEITESAFAKSTQQIISVVKKLMDFGFTLEIDDFGSGYSSLNTLKDVPADVLKLDMRFLESSENTSRGGNILESIVRMAKWLSMTVIAEGVETVEQADYLRSIGCNYIQGFLYAKPAPVSEYEALDSTMPKENMNIVLNTIAKLDNNSFWAPDSIETLIFNSYIGGACVYEVRNNVMELLRINERYASELLGDSTNLENAMTFDIFDHMDAAEIDKLIQNNRKAIHTKEESTCEIRIKSISKERKYEYIHVTTRLIAQADERYLFYCFIINVTERRESESKLRETTEQLSFLNDTASNLLAKADISASIESVLRKVMDFYGGSSAFILEYDNKNDEFIRSFEIFDDNSNYSDPDVFYERELFEKWLYQLETGDSMYIEDTDELNPDEVEICTFFKIRSLIIASMHSDGQFIGTICIINPTINCNQIVNLVSIGRYITASIMRRNLNSKIEANNKMLNDLINDTPGGFTRMKLIIGGGISLVYANNSFCRMLNMTYDEVMQAWGENAYLNIHPDDLQTVIDALDTIQLNNGCVSVQFRLRNTENVYIEVKVFGRLSVNEYGEKFVNLYYSDVSEQSRIEEQRRKLIENIPCGAGLFEILGDTITVIYLNPRYFELVGRTADKINMASAMDSVHPAERENFLRALKELIQHGQRGEYDLHIMHGNGEYKLFRVSGNVIKQQGGNAIIYSTYVPVSDSELKYREMLPVALKTMMSNSSDLSFIKDKNFVYVCCSHAFAQMVGIDDENEIIGKTDFDIFDKKLAEKYRADDIKLLKDEVSLVDSVEKIPSEDGTIRFSSTSKFILRDFQGNSIGLYGIGRDITENREENSRLKFLTGSIAGGIAIYEMLDGVIRCQYISNGIYCITGFPQEEYEELTKDNPLALIYPEDLAEIYRQIDIMLETGDGFGGSFRVQHKGGGFRWINFKVNPAEPITYTSKMTFNVVMLDVTSEKNTELSLIASHRALQIAGTNDSMSFWLFDLDNRTISSEAFDTNVVGYPKFVDNVPDVLIESEIVHPDDRKPFSKMYDEIIGGAEKAECTVRLLNYTTTKYEWQRVVYSRLDHSIYNSNIAIGFAINVDHEQENRQRYERELRLRRELIKSSIFYYQMNLTTNIIEEYYSIYDDIPGMASNIPINQAVLNGIIYNIVPEDVESVKQALFYGNLLQSYREGKTRITLKYRRRIPELGIHWVETSVSILQKPDTNDVIAFIHSKDIDSEMKNHIAVKNILNNEIELLAMVRVKDGKAHYIQSKNTFLGIKPLEEFDYMSTLKKIVSMNVLDDDRKKCFNLLTIDSMVDALSKGTELMHIYRVKCGDKLYHKKIRAFYLDNNEEEIVVARQDITDIYDEEENQKRALQKAVQSANEANSAKSDFLSRMSHDMRTPLNAILAFSGSELTYGASEQLLRNYLDKIHSSSNYLLGIINDVLDMSKIEQKKVVLDPTPYSLIEAINTIIGEISKNRNVEFVLDASRADICCVLVDKVRFNQIFINLLSNAVKFTPNGGKVEFIIEHCANISESCSIKRFIVRDNGIGMSSDFLPHAFENFSQEYNETISEKSQGTGLGLAIVKEIVSLMNGKVFVESEINKGTVFTVELPLEIAQMPTEQKIEVDESISLEGMHILLCEDNLINTEIATRLLEKEGCIVERAENGQRGVEKYLLSPIGYYDVILMDIRMPVMNGIDAARAIRSSEREDAKSIPIVAMTADVFIESAQISQEAGMDMHLSKPIDTKLLYSTLRQLYKK